MKSQVLKKLTDLIVDEATKQIASNYHELLPKIVKVDVDHVEDDLSYAVGAIYFVINGRVLFCPIIYRNGAVDAISYIGDTDTERLYGMTKKMYKKLINASKVASFGEVVDKAEADRITVDQGIIGRLFATPQTLSPKVAEDNYTVISALVENPAFAEQFVKLANDSEMGEVLHSNYPDELFKKAKQTVTMHKIATATREKHDGKVYTKIAELKELPESVRTDAAKQIATNGFYKHAAKDAEKIKTKRVVMQVPLLGEMLMKAKSNLEILTEPGIYNALTRDLDLRPVVVATKGGSTQNVMFYKGRSKIVHDIAQHAGRKEAWYNPNPERPPYVGLEAAAVNDDPRAHIAAIFGGEVDPKKARYLFVTASKNDIEFYEIVAVTKVGNKLVVEVYGDDDNRQIIVGEDYGYTRRGKEIYVNPNHVLFLGKGNAFALSSAKKEHTNDIDPFSELMTLDGFDETFIKTASFDVRYSAGMFEYDGARFTREQILKKLAEDGFNGEDVSKIIKTAEDSAGFPVDFKVLSDTLRAILAQLAENKIALADLRAAMLRIQGGQDAGTAPEEGETESGRAGMVSAAGGQGVVGEGGQPEATTQGAQGDDQAIIDQINQLAASVGINGADVLAAGQAQGMAPAQILQQLQAEIAQLQQAQGQAAAQQQAPAEQDAGVPAGDATAASPQNDGTDTGIGAQNGDIVAQQEEAANLAGEGYNLNVDPNVLAQLSQIADKDVLTAAIISYLVDTDDTRSIAMKYIDDILTGVNGLARTLLMIEIQRNKFSEQVGDKKIAQFLAKGKTLLNRLTDFAVDVAVID